MYLPKILNFGLILLPGYQWLDAAGSADYINNHSKDVVALLTGLPNSTYNEAPIMQWHYVSSDLSPVQASSGPLQLPTCTYADCPAFDYIIIPGPADVLKVPEGFTDFVKTRLDDPQLKALMMICTASLLVGSTGILEGREVATNKVVLKEVATAGWMGNENWPKVNWVGDKRFNIDGKIWSSAGITAGIDLAAEFVRVHFAQDLYELGQEMAEYKPNPAQPDPFAFILDGVQI